MVAMAILGIVLVVFLSTFASVQSAVSREDDKARNNDQARLAMEELDREIRSGNVLYDPSKEAGPPSGVPSCTGCVGGFTLRIYTQSNATTRLPAPGYECRLWRITDVQELQTRFWTPGQGEFASPWSTVATGIVNRIVPSGPVTAFALTSDYANKFDRTIDIALLVNNDWDHYKSDTVRIESSLTGRDTTYGFPADVCD
jgi:type II secretory pathway pseudopilin PulG